MAAISAATYAAYAGVAVAVASAGVGARESQLLGRQAAAEARVPIPPAPQLASGGAQATAQEVQSANTLASTAGASLLSGPQKEGATKPLGTGAPLGQGNALGTAPPVGKSVLGA